MPSRRQFLLAAPAFAGVFSGAAWAQAWPSQPIKIVVTFPLGGSSDIV